jgi:hypothetical protein
MVFVAGSYMSPRFPGVSGLSLFNEPPSASTFPFGRMIAFISMRPVDMFGPAVHDGEAAERSIISVLAVAGLPPPKFIIFGV